MNNGISSHSHKKYVSGAA